MSEPSKITVAQKTLKSTRKASPEVTQAKSKTARTATKTAKDSSAVATVTTSEQRHRLIAEAAYYLAEQRGFQGGSPEQDWFDAASQVDKLFMARS